MKQIISIALCLLSITYIHAQKIFIHVGAGVMNYAGDLQPKTYTLNQAGPAIQIGAGYQLSKHFSLNYFLATGKLQASDANSSSKRAHRNLSFASSIGETDLTLEANLFDPTVRHAFTPYGFVGVGLFRMDPYTFDSTGAKVYLQPLGTEGEGLPEYPDRKPYKLVQFNIPFGVGLRYTVSDYVIVSTEFGFRKTFTDYIDDVSSATYADTAILSAARGPLAAELSYRADELHGPHASLQSQRGNPNKKDFYYNILLKVTFSLDWSFFHL